MMNKLSDYTNKNSIRKRIKSFIAMYLDINIDELTDPMLLLMLESLSEEIYRISGHIDDMEKRIQDKLCSMLVSGIKAMAKPAQAMIHVSPAEDNSLISEQTAFCLASNSNVSFYPVCNTILHKGSVQYILHKGMMYSLDQTQSKTLLTRSKKTDGFKENSFWIGLKLDKNRTDLKGISFYIDFAHSQHRTNYLKFLPYSTWKIQGETLTMTRGLFSIKKTELKNKTLNLFAGYNSSDRINDSVKKEYDPHFLTVDEHFDIAEKRETFPAALTDNFSGRLPDDISEPLVWIEVLCPPEISDDAITSIRISINAVPATCKKLITKTIKLNPNLPVIPLETGNRESFLGVCLLTDSTGKEYYEVPVAENNAYGIYTLRRGGCERYDRREGRQYLVNIIAAMRKEAAAFTGEKAGKKNSLEQVRRDIDSLISDLYNKVMLSANKYELKNYILLTPDINHEHLYFLNYWIASDVSEERLTLGAPLNGQSVSARLISIVKKDRGVPEQAEKYAAYRESVGKGAVLVTDNDIREFCLREFAELISDVKIKKGIIAPTNPQIGFIRTTDVYLKPHKGLENYISIKDEHFICELLKKNSPFTFRYRVFSEKLTLNNKN